MQIPKILVVDDSAAIRRSLIQLLDSLNADIAEAENGKDALDEASKNHYDLIISDIEMPNLNGIELCRQLKSNTKTRGMPVIVVSSFDSDTDINLGFQAGASAYVTKDNAKTSLKQTVEDILSQSKFFRERKILVVDDSPVIRDVVEAGLARAGFQVFTAENGREALRVLNQIRPDLILSDIDMPVMNGFEFCQALHGDSAYAEVPFVVMSANSDRGQMKRLLQFGAAAYLCKPFNIDQLVSLVEKLLSDQFLLLLKEKERLDSERNLMVASITSLVAALEARDANTRGHSEAVGDIVSGMLAMSGAPKREIENGFIGGRLHDIGKIGVRDCVLLKPGRLTKDEFSTIKQHPTIGAEILHSIPSLSEIICIVQSHHERIDGKGYPQGLKGGKIPLWARMTAVADTYHALTSDRPYRKAGTQARALQILKDESGRQLCPDCVKLFLEWIEDVI